MVSHSHRRSPRGRPWIRHGLGLLATVGTVALVIGGSQPVSRYLPAPVNLDDKQAYEPPLISAEELRAWTRRPDAPVIIDVRSPEAYRQGHLPGALNIPGYELPRHLDKVPLGVKLALYCS